MGIDALIPSAVNIIAITALGTFLWRVLDKRFDAVHQRFDRIDDWFDRFDKRFDGIDKRFDRVNEPGNSFDARFDRLEATLDARFEKSEASFDARFQSLDAKFDSLAKDHHNLARELSEFRGETRARLDMLIQQAPASASAAES